MKKIYLFVVAAMAAVTLMAQELPTACDATIEFKYCFTTYGTDAKTIYSSDLPLTWNGVTFPADGTYPMEQNATLTNARGCDSVVTMTVSIKGVPVGAAGGSHARAFSVGENKKVYFSQGNLQYRALDEDGNELKRTCADETEQVGIFRFAENQYDYVGTVETSPQYMRGNVYADGSKCVNDNTNAKSKSWTDYFAWGVSGYNNKYPYGWHKDWYKKTQENTIKTNLDETNYDWGVYNPITNGGNEPGLWRTMSSEEWFYVLTQRTNATDKVAHAVITDEGESVAFGIVLFPDEWNITEVEGITVNTGASASKNSDPCYWDVNFSGDQMKWDYNSFTVSQWETLEATGAVFLPIAGYHNTNSPLGWSADEREARYHTSTKQEGSTYCKGDIIVVHNNNIRILNNQNESGATERFSVRLVTDL